MRFKASRYRAETPPISNIKNDKFYRVVLSTRTGATRLLDERTFQRLSASDFTLISRDITADLIKAELIVPEDEDELATMLDRNAAAAQDNAIAYLVIQPTAACQMGCGYCGQRHTKQVISQEHQGLLAKRAQALLSSGKYKTLRIGWFGGEPLLAMEAIRTLTASLRDVAVAGGCSYDAKIVTNGLLLTPEVSAELVQQLGVSSIEVTVDGTAAYHDQSRPTKGGGPTYSQVLANVIDLARRVDICPKIIVRCNVSRSNRDGVLELLEVLAAHKIQDRINIYAAPIHDWGNQAQADFGTPMADFAEWEITFLIRSIQLGFQAKLIPGRKSINCLTFMPGAEVIDAYGNAFNCTEVSFVPEYENVPDATASSLDLPIIDLAARSNRFATGHLEHAGDFPGRRDVLGGFYDSVKQGAYDCHQCNMLPTCGGHCPKIWLQGSAACPAPKFNIAERLQIFYVLKKGVLDATDCKAGVAE